LSTILVFSQHSHRLPGTLRNFIFRLNYGSSTEVLISHTVW